MSGAGGKGPGKTKSEPVPAGVIRAPSHEGETSTGSLPPPPPPKKKKPWHRTKRGKRDMLRAVKHNMEKQQSSFKTLHEDPEKSLNKIPIHEYPSQAFLQQAPKFMIARYANFLLQSCMLIVRYFVTPKDVLQRFGEGLGSSARMALLMMRSFSMGGNAAKNLQSVTRHLYARCLKDSETATMVQDKVGKEWSTDRQQNLRDRLDEFLQAHVGPGIVEGIYPKTNIQQDIQKQWDDCWPDFWGCSHILYHLFLVLPESSGQPAWQV